MSDWQHSLRYEFGWMQIGSQWIDMSEIVVIGESGVNLRSGVRIAYFDFDSQDSVAEEIIAWRREMERQMNGEQRWREEITSAS